MRWVILGLLVRPSPIYKHGGGAGVPIDGHHAPRSAELEQNSGHQPEFLARAQKVPELEQERHARLLELLGH